MNLALSDEQALLQRTVREFAEAEVQPLAREIDETGNFSRETFRKAAALGLAGVAVPDRYGGSSFDHTGYAIVIDEISRVCASTGVILSVQNSLYADPVCRFGTEEQKEKFEHPHYAEVKAGEAIFHHSLTLHGSGENKSSQPRRAFVINAFADGVVSDSNEPLLEGVPVVPRGEKIEGKFFPLLFDRS